MLPLYVNGLKNQNGNLVFKFLVRKKKIKKRKAETLILTNGQIVFSFQSYMSELVNKYAVSIKPSCFFSLNFAFNTFYGIFQEIEQNIIRTTCGRYKT
jgi:hypothetical protein